MRQLSSIFRSFTFCLWSGALDRSLGQSDLSKIAQSGHTGQKYKLSATTHGLFKIDQCQLKGPFQWICHWSHQIEFGTRTQDVLITSHLPYPLVQPATVLAKNCWYQASDISPKSYFQDHLKSRQVFRWSYRSILGNLPDLELPKITKKACQGIQAIRLLKIRCLLSWYTTTWKFAGNEYFWGHSLAAVVVGGNCPTWIQNLFVGASSTIFFSSQGIFAFAAVTANDILNLEMHHS